MEAQNMPNFRWITWVWFSENFGGIAENWENAKKFVDWAKQFYLLILSAT
jgi:hypothetical protein